MLLRLEWNKNNNKTIIEQKGSTQPTYTSSSTKSTKKNVHSSFQAADLVSKSWGTPQFNEAEPAIYRKSQIIINQSFDLTTLKISETTIFGSVFPKLKKKKKKKREENFF